MTKRLNMQDFLDSPEKLELMYEGKPLADILEVMQSKNVDNCYIVITPDDVEQVDANGIASPSTYVREKEAKPVTITMYRAYVFDRNFREVNTTPNLKISKEAFRFKWNTESHYVLEDTWQEIKVEIPAEVWEPPLESYHLEEASESNC